MKKISTLGVDLAKNVIQLCGTDSKGKVCLTKKIKRDSFAKAVEGLSKADDFIIAMEACGGANHWGRTFRQMGHVVKLIAPQFVKPYVKTNKTDMADAEAIAEAVRRPQMRFVGVKSTDQQDLQNIHRVRESIVKRIVAISNETRGHLTEYGIVFLPGIHVLNKKLPAILEDADNGLSATMRELLDMLKQELDRLTDKKTKLEIMLQKMHRESELSQRLTDIEGIGLITSTAVVAAVGDPNVFENGRQFAAWLGLVPRERSSGGKQRLLGISKRGDRYIRKNLVQGAWSVVRHLGEKTDPRSEWIRKLVASRGKHKTCVALANRNARVIWALMASGEQYRVKE